SRQRRTECNRAERRILPGLWKRMERAIQPSVVRCLQSRRSGLHEILRVKVRARWIWRTRRMHDGEMALLPQRHHGREAGMKPEEAIQIKHRRSRNIDRRTHRVVRRLAMRYYNVQSVGRAALKDDHYPFAARAQVRCAECRSREKRWNGSGTYHRQSIVADKNPACYRHEILT